MNLKLKKFTEISTMRHDVCFTPMQHWFPDTVETTWSFIDSSSNADESDNCKGIRFCLYRRFRQDNICAVPPPPPTQTEIH